MIFYRQRFLNFYSFIFCILLIQFSSVGIAAIMCYRYRFFRTVLREREKNWQKKNQLEHKKKLISSIKWVKLSFVEIFVYSVVVMLVFFYYFSFF